MSQSRIVNRLFTPSRLRSASMPEYILMLTNSITPVVGSVSSVQSISAISGFLGNDAGLGGQFVMGTGAASVGAKTLNMAVDSFIVAAEFSLPALGAIYFTLQSSATINSSEFFGCGFIQDMGQLDVSAPNAQQEILSTTITPGQPFACLVAYDASIDKMRLYARVNGVTLTTPLSTFPDFFAGQTKPVARVRVENYSAEPWGMRNIHVIKLPSRGLPADMSAVFDSYLAAPSALFDLTVL